MKIKNENEVITMEQKAQRYDEALEKAKALYKASEPMSGCNVIIETLFPEIKESEDEKIRKALIDFFGKSAKYGGQTNGVCDKDILAWLGKQGSKDKFIEKELGCIKGYREKAIKRLEELEKQDEQKASYTTIVETGDGGINALVTLPIEMKTAAESLGVDSETYNKIIDECIFDEQKPTDNVGPKFHEGEWVIDKQGIVHQISNVIENVTNHTYGYDIVGGGYFNDNTEGVRLWTIEDAKDGDVLYINNTVSESIMIYKSFNNGVIKKYASYNKFGFEGEHYLTLNDGYIIPATKEQRDLLFEKMKKAGYEWDAEKKELKKIEEKPADSYCQENCKGFQETGKCFADGECKAKKEAKQKPVWKPTDEQIKVCKEVYADILSAKGFDLGTVVSELNRLEEGLKKKGE